jgi:hypothetical protein
MLGRACHDANLWAGQSFAPSARSIARVGASRRPWRHADRSGRRTTASSASQALGPTRLQYPAQTRPHGYRRCGCRRQERRPSNGRHGATAACSRTLSGCLPGVANTKRPESLRCNQPAPPVTRGSAAITRDQRRAGGCPCRRADCWRAAVGVTDNRAVGNHSALFELQAPGELAQMLVEPTERLTGCPTSPTGDRDSLPQPAFGAIAQPHRSEAQWRP